MGRGTNDMSAFFNRHREAHPSSLLPATTMDVMRKRLRMMRGDGVTHKPSPATTPMTTPSSSAPSPSPPSPRNRESAKRPRQPAHSSTAFTSRMTGTVQSATMPFKRLLERVKFRLATSKSQQDRKKKATRPSTRETTRENATVAAHMRRSMARLESLRFCIASDITCRSEYRGWTVQRRFLLDEAQFVWLVTEVTSAQAWAHDGIRPGDVLESVGGVQLAEIAEHHDVETLLLTATPGCVLRFRVRCPFDRCRVERAVVHVEGGPLGISIIADGSDAVPVVFELAASATGSVGVQRQKRALIRVGDVLSEVNGQSVLGRGIPAVMAMVKSCGGHMTLTFQHWTHEHCGPRCRNGARLCSSRLHHPESDSQKPQRRIVGQWFMRPSGSEFHDDSGDEDRETEEDVDRDVVVLVWRSGVLGMTMLNDEDAKMPRVNRLTGKGATPGIEKLRHGYHLASINGVSTHQRDFREVMRDLERLPKPLWLVFVPPFHRGSMYTTGARTMGSEIARGRERTARWSTSSSLISLDETWDTAAEVGEQP